MYPFLGGFFKIPRLIVKQDVQVKKMEVGE